MSFNPLAACSHDLKTSLSSAVLTLVPKPEFLKYYKSLSFVLLSIYCIHVPFERDTLINTVP